MYIIFSTKEGMKMSEVQENVSVESVDVAGVVPQFEDAPTENVLPPEDVFCRQVDVIVALRSAFSKFVEGGGTDLGDLVGKINGELGSMPLFKAQGGLEAAPAVESSTDQT